MVSSKQQKAVTATVALTLAVIGVATVAYRAGQKSTVASENEEPLSIIKKIKEEATCSCQDNFLQIESLIGALNTLEEKVGDLAKDADALAKVSTVEIEGPSKPTQNMKLDQVVEFRGRTSYTLDFEIKILGTDDEPTGVFQIGDKQTIRSPGIFVLGNNRRQLGFRQQSETQTNWYGSQCNPGESVTPWQTWFKVKVTADQDYWKVFYNEKEVCSLMIDVLPPPGQQSVWFMTNQYAAADVEVKNLKFEIQ